MFLGKNVNNVPIGYTIIDCDESVKLLGVIIDRNMNYQKHVTNICKKASIQLNAFSRIRHFLDTDGRITLVRSFIMSNFNYCPLIWHFCGKTHTAKLERLLYRALRLTFNDFV
jgi:hypothetical protein